MLRFIPSTLIRLSIASSHSSTLKFYNVTATNEQRQAFSNLIKFSDTQALSKVLTNSTEKLNDSNIAPLSTSVAGMQRLLNSEIFINLVQKHVPMVTNYLLYKRDHSLWKNVAQPVVYGNSAPSINENDKNHPVPLAFRGVLISLLGNLIYKNDIINTCEENLVRNEVQAIAEINGLIESAINMHRNISKFSDTDKLGIKINKLAILGGDFLLAKACQLLADLESPKAVEKISESLSKISQNAASDEDHSDLLLKNCCEAIVIIDADKSESQISGDLIEKTTRKVVNFIDNLNNGYIALIQGDNNTAFECKERCLEALDGFEIQRVEKMEYKELLRHLVHAFLPVEIQK